MKPIRKKGLKVAISLCRQTDYLTALPNSNIDKSIKFEHSLLEEPIDKFNDAAMVGDGHGYPSYIKNRSIDVKGNFATDLSSFIGPLFFGLNMGKIESEKVVNTENVYKHTITLSNIDDPLVGKQKPCTTWIYGLDSAYQKKYRSISIKSVTVSGKTGEQLKINAEVIGAGHYEILETPVTMPDIITGTAFLRLADVTFTFGSDFSADLKDFQFKQINSYAEKDGYFPGAPFLVPNNNESPQTRGRLYCTGSSTELSFKILMDPDSSIEADQLNNTNRPLTIKAEGKIIEGTHKHAMEINFENVAIESNKIADDEELYVYDIKTQVNKGTGTNSPVTIIFTNNVPSYLTLPA